MKGIIDVRNSNFKGFEFIAYFPSCYFNGQGWDLSHTDSDCLFLFSSCLNLNVDKILKTKEGKPFILLNAKSIFADVNKITSNVEIRVTRSFNVLQWIGFGFISSYRYLRGFI